MGLKARRRLSPPVAPRRPTRLLLHGDERWDDYHWLRDRDDPAVAAYLEAENAYTEAVMRETGPLQRALYREMLARIEETDLTVPYRKGGFLYYTRTRQGEQYPLYCRRRGRGDAAERVLLDVNELAAGRAYLAVGLLEVSDDGALLAFSTDDTGDREFTLRFKDLRTGALLPDRIEGVKQMAWAADGRTFFYTQDDRARQVPAPRPPPPGRRETPSRGIRSFP